MPYIVKEAGFYGGMYYKAGKTPQPIPDAIAAPFASPYGHQLEAAPEKSGADGAGVGAAAKSKPKTEVSTD
ncbi:hypothetical protein NPA31_007170 [Aurantimonas sp. MSK8Z-1]|uniref:hypothetical protein n=1 Tax=Mangrovibrevibacter kandeliae TaxID=2968473 RepID=UPI002118D0FC|nr:hypothetical protein [Aurantimonas sp. MSK8Z-1]MCW4114742.1 hypothetical protein [Aurantimonas sp. MSK8Z-1]